MSGWLKSVNNLLETIDNGVGDVVEHQAEKLEELYDEDATMVVDGDDGVGGHSSVDDILAKRGLLLQDDEDDEDDEEEDVDVDGVDVSGNHGGDGGTHADTPQGDINYDDLVAADANAIGNIPESQNPMDNEETNETAENIGNSIQGDPESVEKATDEMGEEPIIAESDPGEKIDVFVHGSSGADTEKIVQSEEQENDNDAGELNSPHSNDNDTVDADAGTIEQKQSDQNDGGTTDVGPNAKDEGVTIPVKQSSSKPTPTPSPQPAEQKALQSQIQSLQKIYEAQKKLTQKATTEKSASDKETRKLRRTLVKLNAELDSAERELEAQRTELERAAARMEKDRQRSKQEKDRLEMSHKEDLKAVAEEHKQSISSMVETHLKQMKEMEERIERAEEARVKEGGDMSTELTQAITRERQLLDKIRILEDESQSYAAQVASLKNQSVGMESRMDSLTQAVESAREQERDADDRLEKALSIHARQLGTRQARENELERTIADLSAALVAARSKEATRDSSGNNGERVNNMIAELKDALLSAKDEVETLHTQVMMEQQKAETLQGELEDVSKEREEEVSEALERQKDYDRRVVDLTSTITKLQLKQNSSSRLFNGTGYGGNGVESEAGSDSGSTLMVEKLQKQVANLSENIIRQKAKLQHSTTEVQTLRNRLKSAQSRAEIAEKAAQQANSFDLERGSSDLHTNNPMQMRRRYGIQSRKAVTSISSVFKLDAGRGEVKESIGKVVDTIDTIAINTGSWFRSDPVSRAFFLLYLLILHLWAFCLVLFHAHGTLEPSSDVGPEQLLKHSYRHIEQSNGMMP